MLIIKSISRISFALFILMLTLGVTPAYAAGILYVTPSGTGDCLAWETACTLQTALTGATSGNEIWVAAGTYKPTTGTDRAATFQLKDGVAIYGGFNGTETLRDERNITTNITILSGDLNNNDIGFTNNGENTYHVIVGANGAILDGFTVISGNADGSFSGGGMYNNASSPILSNIIFDHNSAGSGGGGGMSNQNTSNPVLADITFINNTANLGGGGCQTVVGVVQH